MINIAGLDKGAVVQALFARAHDIGSQDTPTTLLKIEADRIAVNPIRFYRGRAMFVNVNRDEIDETEYDKRAGKGAAADVIGKLRGDKPAPAHPNQANQVIQPAKVAHTNELPPMAEPISANRPAVAVQTGPNPVAPPLPH